MNMWFPHDCYPHTLACENCYLQDIAFNVEANQTLVDFIHRKIRGIVKDMDTADALCSHDYPIGSKRCW